MRPFVAAVLLTLPLQAGDPSPLAQAVARFQHPDAAQREAGSQLAARELRRLLQPLLAALEDKDPEVRRRARNALLTVLPDLPVRVEPALAPVQPQGFLLRAQAVQRMRGAQAELKNTAARLRLRKYGAVVVAKPLLAVNGRVAQAAASVARVLPGSAAERRGLRAGDVIHRIGGKPFRDFATARVDEWDRLPLEIVREGQRLVLPPLR